MAGLLSTLIADTCGRAASDPLTGARSPLRSGRPVEAGSLRQRILAHLDTATMPLTTEDIRVALGELDSPAATLCELARERKIERCGRVRSPDGSAWYQTWGPLP